MAMLAEPRRKQKWSVDPRNSTWSKDESKFGQKMLEKMGWSKGKGLGAQEQGSTEHIKVQVKNNTLGLGAAINHEDNWIAHQDDYNQLLAELNDCHGTAGSVSESPASDSKKSFSLEEKSKSSKKRVHYMKFAKGKDLSSRSDTDLACIFGKREKTKKSNQEEADGDSEESEEQEKETSSPPDEVEMGNTVTSTLSVNEYFAKRMAELKKARSRLSQDSQQNAEVTPADSTDVHSEEPKKKRKKKKRSKNKDDCSDEPEPVESTRGDDIMYERKKPKSKKGEDPARPDITDNTEEQEEEEHTWGEKLKKKKKNKRKKEAMDISERENDSSLHDTTAEEPKKKKKKKQK